ncbi:MAG: ARMT1-like domain-containing protein [Bacteroidota bacterium]
MKTHFECIPCIVNSYLRLAETDIIPEFSQEKILRQLLQLLSEEEYEQSPPVLGRGLHRMIRESLNNPDPYFQIKQDYNRMMMELYPSFKKMVEKSEDPFETAMRLAIGGNVIDFGAKYQFDVMGTINKVMESELAIDDSRSLQEELEHAQTLLYIGDNCGEIVLDKLFLETIQVPRKYFVVRESPIINDITMEDAKVTGMDKISTVITTGDNSPGAVWESASKEFKDHFINADVVISKGQGNLEGLLDVPHDHIYFLLVTKCELIGDIIGTRKGDFVVKQGVIA